MVNGPGSTNTKRAQMTQIINSDVDVDGIGRFCLGRFWKQATPEQQKQYLALFHEVLVTNITAKLGEYQGVTFTMGRSRPQDEEAVVSTTVVRPNNAPTAVDWIIANPATEPKIIDVVAEGTSLRLTQRQDYASYLTHNNGNVDALIARDEEPDIAERLTSGGAAQDASSGSGSVCPYVEAQMLSYSQHRVAQLLEGFDFPHADRTQYHTRSTLLSLAIPMIRPRPARS